MTVRQSLLQAFAGSDVRMRRQIMYWALTLFLYAVSVALLLVEVALGAASPRPADWLVAAIVVGVGAFYVAIRASGPLTLTPQLLAIAQATYAIACIVAAYAIVGSARGYTLSLLLVVLVFCAFSLTPRQAHAVSLFAVCLLGATMFAMNRVDPLQYEGAQELAHLTLAASMLGAVGFLTGQLSLMRRKLKGQKAELAEALARIQEMATRDDLTLLTNRRHMNELLAYEKQRHDRKGRSLCLALLDIDWFKRINDTLGHAVGDQVLRAFAQHALPAIRTTDVLARWGGEEFLLMLPDTDLAAATQVLGRIQARIAAQPLVAADASIAITFSAGVTVARNGDSLEAAIERADRAMYAAKAAGRNRLVCA